MQENTNAAALSLDRMLRDVASRGGSDLHLVSGQPPRMRHLGELEQLGSELLAKQFVIDELDRLMPAAAKRAMDRCDGADFGFSIDGVARYRVNVFRHLDGLGAVFRAIPPAAKTLAELGLPVLASHICRLPRGLILVTGKSGSGKSTTLAAMIDQINTERRGHIITIEDPIEYIHQRKNSLISQREVGVHTTGFPSALRSALREDPNVIMIGELRDLETMSLAVTAAETGVLVFSTLHTSSTISTVERLINSFPANRQYQIRAMLSTSLRAVFAQQLLKTTDGNDRVVAVEVMVNNTAIANLIREAKTDQLESALQGGALIGMQTMDSALRKLLEGGRISAEEAHQHATRKDEFQRFLPPSLRQPPTSKAAV